jgi:hypothetical protein
VQSSFSEPSQLSLPNHTTANMAIKLGALKKDGKGHVTYQENKTEALWRCAREIELWVKANSSAISPQAKQEIEQQLSAYKAALPQVLAFIEGVKIYNAPKFVNPGSGILPPSDGGRAK